MKACDVINGKAKWSVQQGDCIEWLDSLPPNSVDLVFGSPPYMDARTYGIDAVYDCQEWVDWMLWVTEAAVRVSKGLVLWVAAGVQRDKCYWPGCEGLMWEWWKRGNQLWRPCIWWKVDEEEGGTGIPGSGGKQWLRNDWEYVMAFKKEGWLPWADNCAMGHAPVYSQIGGEMSNRTQDGQRINARTGTRLTDGRLEEWAEGQEPEEDDPWGKRDRGNSLGGRRQNGEKMRGTGPTRRASGKKKKVLREMDVMNGSNPDGTLKENRKAPMPKVANPGNCIIVKARVGGGHMGSRLCHSGEAPFPEKLAEFFVKSFCPPSGIVADCFVGTGTTASEALRNDRRFVGCDLRESQVELTKQRIHEALGIFNVDLHDTGLAPDIGEQIAFDSPDGQVESEAARLRDDYGLFS